MTLLHLLSLTVLFAAAAVSPQAQEVRLTGTVTDAQTGEPLRDANVFVAAEARGAISGADGRYELRLPAGRHEVRYSYIGYEAQTLTLTLVRDTAVDVALEPRAVLDRIEVVAEDDTALEAPTLGVTRLEMRELQRLPTLMGEVDVTRSVLMLPGVTSVGEGTAGLNVRGGNVDQNLMLLDGTQVFFSSHLFGMFSAFNPDLLEDVTL